MANIYLCHNMEKCSVCCEGMINRPRISIDNTYNRPQDTANTREFIRTYIYIASYMLICMREINAYIWLGKSCCVIWMIQKNAQNHLIKIMSSNIIILGDKLIMRVWSIRALNRWGILWLLLEPCKIECLWSQGSSLQLPISITPVTTSRENDRTGKDQAFSTYGQWIVDFGPHSCPRQKREEARKVASITSNPNSWMHPRFTSARWYDRDQDTVFWNSFPLPFETFPSSRGIFDRKRKHFCFLEESV